MVKCTSCGEHVVESKFCGSCGAQLPPTAAEAWPAAEQRHLIVLFCDLVGSTELSEELGAEEYAYVLKEYQALAYTAMEPFEGRVRQYLGDGILVIFGYPRAHEDDVRRAILTARAIQGAIKRRNAKLDTRGKPIEVRVGIHAGTVVVGAVGTAGSIDDQPSGLTLNIAARLQAIATPGTIVVSETVRSLAMGFFKFAELGTHRLKGVSEAMPLFKVEDEVTRSRFDASAARGLTPFVGRREEIAALRACWEDTRAGGSAVVSIRGEAGIGKSRLTRLIAEEALRMNPTLTDCECSAYHTNTTLYPIVEALGRQMGLGPETMPGDQLVCLERFLSGRTVEFGRAAPLLASLMGFSFEPRYSLPPMGPELQREETLKLLLALARDAKKPHMIVFEDLQWADATTIELIKRLVDEGMPPSTMLVTNCRPEFFPSWATERVSQKLNLDRLPREDLKALISRVAVDQRLPSEVAEVIARTSDGIPLFAEELTKTVLESGTDAEMKSHSHVPTSLQNSLMARLDRLGFAKDLAQRAAVIGRRFQYLVLLGIADVGEVEARAGIERLIRAGLVFTDSNSPQALYEFKHALVQVAAYESLLRRSREELHRRVVVTLEAAFPQVVANEPELLALHCQLDGMADKAVNYWLAAGTSALARSANVEAAAHLRAGRALLSQIDDVGERRRLELRLLTVLGPALIANMGFAAPEVGEVFDRGRVLCETLPGNPETFPVLAGSWVYFLVRGELELSRHYAEEMLALGQRTGNDHFLIEARYSLGNSNYWLGEANAARQELQAAAILYNPERHASHALQFGQDPGVTTQCYLSFTFWMLGRPDEAKAALDAAVRMAEPLNHPFTTAWPKAFRTVLHAYRNEPKEALEAAEELIAFSLEQQQQYWLAAGFIVRGWGMACAGKVDEGLAEMQRGISGYAATGAGVSLPYFYGLLTEVLLIAGRIDEAEAALDRAFETARTNNEGVSESALWRIKGSLLEAGHPDDLKDAIECYRHAVDCNAAGGVLAPRLRAATALHLALEKQGLGAVRESPLAGLVARYPAAVRTPDLAAGRAALKATQHESG
jgi:class 3 adenylate cyclase/predicted ATPase